MYYDGDTPERSELQLLKTYIYIHIYLVIYTYIFSLVHTHTYASFIHASFIHVRILAGRYVNSNRLGLNGRTTELSNNHYVPAKRGAFGLLP